MENSRDFISNSLLNKDSGKQKLQPSRTFPELIFFHVEDKSSEISNRGVAQMGFQMFQCFYEQVFYIFELPPLTEQPRVDLYADGTFSINWWGEILYCKNNNEFFDHLTLLNDRFKGKAHKNFKEKEAQIYEKFRVKVEEVRNKLNRPSSTISEDETRQILQQKEEKIREQEKQIQKLLKENQEQKADQRTEKEELSQEIEKLRKREKAKIKEIEEQRFIQTQQMQVSEEKTREQEKQIQKLLKENQEQKANLEEADRNQRAEKERMTKENEELRNKLQEKETKKREEEKRKEQEEQKRIQQEQKQKAEEKKKAVKQQETREQKKERHRRAINNLLDDEKNREVDTMRARREYIRAHFSKSLQRCQHSTHKVDWTDNCVKNKDAAVLVTKQKARRWGCLVHLQCFFATIAQDLGEDWYAVAKEDLLESLDTPLLDHWD